MPTVPDTFRAYVVERHENEQRLERGVRELRLEDLPPGEVTIRVEWSSVNFKDGLAARFDGKVARISPLVPGIDLAGTVAASDDPAFQPGDGVLANGYEIGVSQHGGYAEYARLPAGWVVPQPSTLTARDAMALGTAGFTAGLSVEALEGRGLGAGDGPVLVTGATGGVGRLAVGLLAARGYEVWAATGKPGEADRLRALGAAHVMTRDEVTAESPKPMESGRWAGAIDTVGGPTLPYILRTLRTYASVASCGNTGGIAFSTTTQPFILRGVSLLGMTSATTPIGERRALWARLATDYRPVGLGEDITEVTLETLDEALDGIVAGRARGRWIVRVGG
jgi:acrylyl-CoA reductase (NADPH)